MSEAALLVTSSLDCSVRFWDVDATPHPLTAPEGGAHVRVRAAQSVSIRLSDFSRHLEESNNRGMSHDLQPSVSSVLAKMISLCVSA